MSDYDKIKVKHLLSAMELYYHSGKPLPLMPEDLDLLRRVVNSSAANSASIGKEGK